MGYSAAEQSGRAVFFLSSTPFFPAIADTPLGKFEIC